MFFSLWLLSDNSQLTLVLKIPQFLLTYISGNKKSIQNVECSDKISTKKCKKLKNKGKCKDKKTWKKCMETCNLCTTTTTTTPITTTTTTTTTTSIKSKYKTNFESQIFPSRYFVIVDISTFLQLLWLTIWVTMYTANKYSQIIMKWNLPIRCCPQTMSSQN